MTGVTHIVDGVISQHLPSLSAMRIVTGSTAHLHIAKLGAKQVSRALEKCLSLLHVAAQTSFLDIWPGQHVYRQSSVKDFRHLRLGFFAQVQRHSFYEFRVVNAMTRKTAHVPPVVLPATPLEMGAFASVTDETGLIGVGGAEGGWIDRSGSVLSPGAILRVLLTVAMARLALRAARIAQELSAFAMSVEGERLHDQPVALLAVLTDRLLNALRGDTLGRGGLSIRHRSAGPQAEQ